MLLTSSDAAGVELRPVRHQFATVPNLAPGAGDRDANRLQVEGAVRTAAGEPWTFGQPCPTTVPARR